MFSLLVCSAYLFVVSIDYYNYYVLCIMYCVPVANVFVYYTLSDHVMNYLTTM